MTEDVVEMAEAAAAQPAGWHSNPAGPGLRYWDGTEWTENYHPGHPGSEAGTPKETLWALSLGFGVAGGLPAAVGSAGARLLLSAGPRWGGCRACHRGIHLGARRFALVCMGGDRGVPARDRQRSGWAAAVQRFLQRAQRPRELAKDARQDRPR